MRQHRRTRRSDYVLHVLHVRDVSGLTCGRVMIMWQIRGRGIVSTPVQGVIDMAERRGNRTIAIFIGMALLGLSACSTGQEQASGITSPPAPVNAAEASSALPSPLPSIVLATVRDEKTFLSDVDAQHPELRTAMGAAAGPATDATLLSLGDSVIFYAQSWTRDQIVSTFGESWHITRDQAVWFVDNALSHLKAVN